MTPDELIELIDDAHPYRPDLLSTEKLNVIYQAIWNADYTEQIKIEQTLHRDFIDRLEVNNNHAGIGKTKIGLVLTAWNRPEYLSQCLVSLKQSNLSDTCLVIVDDHSDDLMARKLIAEFDLPIPVIKIFKSTNTKMHISLDMGWCLLAKLNCQYLCNIDSDAIVHPDWLRYLTASFEAIPHNKDDLLLSGFNRANRCDVIEECAYYYRKRKMGGINYFFTPAFYQEMRILMFNANWDSHIQFMIEQIMPLKYKAVSTKPSVIQHVGEYGHNSNVNSEFDRATDFDSKAALDFNLLSTN